MKGRVVPSNSGCTFILKSPAEVYCRYLGTLMFSAAHCPQCDRGRRTVRPLTEPLRVGCICSSTSTTRKRHVETKKAGELTVYLQISLTAGGLMFSTRIQGSTDLFLITIWLMFNSRECYRLCPTSSGIKFLCVCV